LRAAQVAAQVAAQQAQLAQLTARLEALEAVAALQCAPGQAALPAPSSATVADACLLVALLVDQAPAGGLRTCSPTCRSRDACRPLPCRIRPICELADAVWHRRTEPVARAARVVLTVAALWAARV